MITLRRSRFRVLLVPLVLIAFGVLDVVHLPAVGAAPTVQVKFVNHYSHGRVKLGVNDVTRRLGSGQVKGPFAVTPDDGHNDFTYVKALRFHRCGESDIGYYFRPGHSYKVVVTGVKVAGCENSAGEPVKGPHAEVIRVS